MTVSDWRADQFDWKSISASIRRDFGVSFLFSVTNYIDWKDTNKSSLYVSLGDFQLLNSCEKAAVIDQMIWLNSNTSHKK